MYVLFVISNNAIIRSKAIQTSLQKYSVSNIRIYMGRDS